MMLQKHHKCLGDVAKTSQLHLVILQKDHCATKGLKVAADLA